MRKKIGLYLLNKKVKHLKREKIVCNLNEAKNIGIIFNPTTSEVFSTVVALNSFLIEKGIKTTSVAYINEKILPDFCSSRKAIKFITLKDLNWYRKPNISFVNDFIKFKFDILIDLTLEYFYPVYYINSLSQAKFKAGKTTTIKTPLDLMIDIEKERSVEYLIDQLKHYLSIIKNKS